MHYRHCFVTNWTAITFSITKSACFICQLLADADKKLTQWNCVLEYKHTSVTVLPVTGKHSPYHEE